MVSATGPTISLIIFVEVINNYDIIRSKVYSKFNQSKSFQRKNKPGKNVLFSESNDF